MAPDPLDGLELPERTARLAAAEDPADVDGYQPDQPLAVLPQAPQARRPAIAKTAPQRRRMNAGDRICGECGEGNPAIRKFCRRCGSSLMDAEVVKEKWWRRIFQRKPQTLKAGGRPGQPGVKLKRRFPEISSILRPIRWAVGACVLIAAVAYGTYSPFQKWVDTNAFDIKTRVTAAVHPTYSEVRPVAVTAAAADSIAGHGASLIADGYYNTFWAAPATVTDPSVTLRFGGTVSLDKVDLHNGAYGDYTAYNRPEQLHLVYSNGQSDTLNVTDQSAVQTLTLHHANGITWVQIQVTEQYQSVKGDKPVAISEIEFFQQTNS